MLQVQREPPKQVEQRVAQLLLLPQQVERPVAALPVLPQQARLRCLPSLGSLLRPLLAPDATVFLDACENAEHSACEGMAAGGW